MNRDVIQVEKLLKFYVLSILFHSSTIYIYIYIFFFLSSKIHKRRTQKRVCANTKSISPYFYIMPAVHKNRYKLIRYIKVLHIHDHTVKESLQNVKKIGIHDIAGSSKRVVYIARGVIIILPKIQECQRSLYPKFKERWNMNSVGLRCCRDETPRIFPFCRNTKRGTNRTAQRTS